MGHSMDVVTNDTIADDLFEELEQENNELMKRIEALEKENAELKSAEAKLVTVADYIATVMIEQNIENFTTNNFKVDDRQLELTCRFVEGKTTADVLNEQKQEIVKLKGKVDECHALLNELDENDQLSVEGSERYHEWLDNNEEADVHFVPGMH